MRNDGRQRDLKSLNSAIESSGNINFGQGGGRIPIRSSRRGELSRTTASRQLGGWISAQSDGAANGEESPGSLRAARSTDVHGGIPDVNDRRLLTAALIAVY